MGATCKFKSQFKECPEINNETLPNQIESTIKVKKGFKGRQQENQTQESSPNKFYIIYPKSREQLEQLYVHLQNLICENLYRIEELEVCTSNYSKKNKIESCFSLNSEDDESFNIFKR